MIVRAVVPVTVASRIATRDFFNFVAYPVLGDYLVMRSRFATLILSFLRLFAALILFWMPKIPDCDL